MVAQFVAGAAAGRRGIVPDTEAPMRSALVLVILAGWSTVAAAHPAVGIVIDREGTVFFSDTVHVWMNRPDGHKAIAVRDVHTHELRLDADGALVGEHLAYDAGRWSHRVWRRGRDGQVHDLVPTRPGFLGDYHDVALQQDAGGTIYWMEGRQPASLRARGRGAAIRTIAEFPFDNQSWLSVQPDGTAYVSEDGVVWRVRPGAAAERLAADLSSSRERLAVMGVAEGADGAVYVAAYADGVVRRLRAGRIEVVATSGQGWGPTGVAVAPDGTLWVLEASTSNQQRVRRVGRDGRVRIF